MIKATPVFVVGAVQNDGYLDEYATWLCGYCREELPPEIVEQLDVAHSFNELNLACPNCNAQIVDGEIETVVAPIETYEGFDNGK